MLEKWDRSMMEKDSLWARDLKKYAILCLFYSSTMYFHEFQDIFVNFRFIRATKRANMLEKWDRSMTEKDSLWARVLKKYAFFIYFFYSLTKYFHEF